MLQQHYSPKKREKTECRVPTLVQRTFNAIEHSFILRCALEPTNRDEDWFASTAPFLSIRRNEYCKNLQMLMMKR